MVGVVRLELTRGYPHGILSAVRLPIPPHPHKRDYSDIGRTPERPSVLHRLDVHYQQSKNIQAIISTNYCITNYLLFSLYNN